MKAKKFFKIITLNHESMCRCLGGKAQDSQASNYMQLLQRKARLAYVAGIFLVGIIAFFTKLFAEEMFYFVYNSLYCSMNSFVHSCFTMVMIYRLSFTIWLYHFVMFLLNTSKMPALIFFSDFCWMLKAVIFVNLFFVFCLIPNSFFQFTAMVSKYTVAVLLALQTIMINDGLFFYLNKKRFAYRGSFSKAWNVFAYIIGFLALAAGLALFIFCFIWYDSVCEDYKAINATIFSLSGLVVLLNVVKYKQRVEVTHSFVFFFVMSISNYGILAGSPYSKCVNVTNRNFLYSYTSTNLDAIFSGLIRLFVQRVRSGLSGQ
jgi:hypothetical protein